MNSNLNVSRYKEDIEKELKRRAVVMERILLMIAPISVLFLLNGVLLFRAFIDWALFKQDFTSNHNLVWVGYSKYIILPFLLLVFVYNIYAVRKEAKYGKL